MIRNSIKRYLTKLENEGKSTNTVRGYATDLNRFMEWLDGSWNDVQSIDQLSKTIIREYKQFVESNYAPNTSNHNLIAIRGLLEFEGMNDIAKSIKLKSIATQNETKWIERSDVAKLFHAIEVQPKWNDNRKAMNRAIMAVLVNCGLRVQELCDLKVNDVLLDSGILNVTNGKGNKFRRVPFGDKTATIIREWLSVHNGGEYMFYSQRTPQMTTRAVQHMIKGLSDSTGVEFTPHVGRHTFGKNVANQTNRIESVASLLGHSNIQTTRRYIEPSMNELRDAITNVEFE